MKKLILVTLFLSLTVWSQTKEVLNCSLPNNELKIAVTFNMEDYDSLGGTIGE